MPQSYGVVTIDGKNYLERWQVIPFEQAITVNGQVINPVKVQLPGSYDFRLKALTRVVIKNNVPDSTVEFKIRLGNTDGSIWYSQGGAGATTERVLSSLLFGDAKLPYVVIPELYFSKNGAINMELEDISQNQPYRIFFAFHGAFLIPID